MKFQAPQPLRSVRSEISAGNPKSWIARRAGPALEAAEASSTPAAVSYGEPVGRQTHSPVRERWDDARETTELSPAKGALGRARIELPNDAYPGLVPWAKSLPPYGLGVVAY